MPIVAALPAIAMGATAAASTATAVRMIKGSGTPKVVQQAQPAPGISGFLQEFSPVEIAVGGVVGGLVLMKLLK